MASSNRYAKTKHAPKFFDLDAINDDPMSEIISDFKKYIDDNIKGTKKRHAGNRAYELHPSSFPYCGLQHWYTIMKDGGVDEWQELDFYGEFYTSNGTITHELIQEWLGKGGKLLGNWKCLNKKCSGTRKFSVYKPCPICKGEMEYHELGVKFGKHTTGHLDGLYLVKKKGKYYIIDYKTCGVEAIRKHQSGAEKVFPYLKNVAQIESYCHYVEDNYGIKVGGWLLVYLTRDAAFRNYEVVGKKFSGSYKARVIEKCEKSDKHFGIAIKERKLKNVKTLIEEKPCDCRATYEKEFHNKYDPCPLEKVCFKRESLIKELKKVERAFKPNPELSLGD